MFRLSLVTVALAALAACQGSQSDITPTYQGTATCAPASTAGTASKTPAVQPALMGDVIPQVTFYGDLLPVLQSQAYGCTTCHPNYLGPEGLASLDQVNQVIDSMTAGRMPSKGTKVPADKIQLFRTWQLQGFQPGVEGQKANVSSQGTSASSVSASTTCTTAKTAP